MATKKLNIQPCALPLKDDRSVFFLKIVTGVAVFLFALTFCAYLFISSGMAHWKNSVTDGMTVQIMPSAETLSEEEAALRTNKVIRFFEGLPQTEKVVLLEEKQIERLLKPWLGENADISALPLPQLLDVKLKSNSGLDYAKLTQDLKKEFDYAKTDSHALWLNQLLGVASSLKTLSLSVLLLIAGICVFSIFYATETSLGIHKEIIEILHIMGATDSYVAKQYAVRSFWVGLWAGLAGTLVCCVAVGVIAHLAEPLKTGLMSGYSVSAVKWLLLAFLPVASAVLSMLTAYVSVKQTLGKIV